MIGQNYRISQKCKISQYNNETVTDKIIKQFKIMINQGPERENYVKKQV